MGSSAITFGGFAEELAKGALIVVVGWKLATSTRDGLFVGGVVGLGFAILES
ncbi:PrsW family glutamic-type intramembrane protease [Microbacterium trichothecenolyticum]|uniref:RsiW-degrading membrane proteinase PrsW (M82 family) n=1 Tax=Microbacterium trichothecenolyticum TaxID=69370 RepID=A0ABU0TXL0_MICTR|nr:PrsW family glutamic-type intramembrane protease [Microbacterium trichothecenolyticum]MDQ1124386.1 RsiW-degrading membrane proteinase PrsW (M82 family) [Microbacterium trichothecenolyticum]